MKARLGHLAIRQAAYGWINIDGYGPDMDLELDLGLIGILKGYIFCLGSTHTHTLSLSLSQFPI